MEHSFEEEDVRWKILDENIKDSRIQCKCLEEEGAEKLETRKYWWKNLGKGRMEKRRGCNPTSIEKNNVKYLK